LPEGLALNRPYEWFGPALPVAAHRLLIAGRSYLTAEPEAEPELDRCLDRLKKLALTPIVDGKFLKRDVQPSYYQWHIGQVVAEFPNESSFQQKELNLEGIAKLANPSDRAYALARVVQGAVAINDDNTRRQALDLLYACQNLDRPLGSGIIGDHIKASFNTLEAIWPALEAPDLREVNSMLDALLIALKRTHPVGILVAIKTERDACVQQFEADGASVTENENVVDVDHPDYRVVIIVGKALIAATEAAGRLLNEYHVTSAVLVGIAGSLGQRTPAEFKGPNKGDVVIGTCTAAYRIREKARGKEPSDAPVPWHGTIWDILPTDPTLFALAHRVGQDLALKMEAQVHEGLIVTGNGIKDNPAEKKRVREKWPGGLAVAVEGFTLALGCMQHHVPQIEIRGISDLAEGDKAKQKTDPAQEKLDQELAAKNAATIAVALVKALSKSW